VGEKDWGKPKDKFPSGIQGVRAVAVEGVRADLRR